MSSAVNDMVKFYNDPQKWYPQRAGSRVFLNLHKTKQKNPKLNFDLLFEYDVDRRGQVVMNDLEDD